MKYDVLCAGLATYDTMLSPVSSDIMTTDGCMVDEIRTGSGGDAVNASISMAKLGVKVCIAACVGDDSFADFIEYDLKRAGVATEGLYRNKELFTNSPVVLIDNSGDRHIIRTAKGGNRFFEAKHIPDVLLRESKHLHIASINMLPKLDGEPLAELFKKAHEYGITTSMDASFDKQGLWMERIRNVIPHCDIFIPSYQEARYYAGSDKLQDIKEHFSKFNLKYFGVKLGADGVFITDFDNDYSVPSLYEGIVVDTTGAGDAFFAGFISGYVKKLDLYSCTLLGSAQAASVLGAVGANRSSGTWDDAIRLIRKKGLSLTTVEGRKI